MPTAAVNTASHITLGFNSIYRSLKDPVPFASMLSNVFNSTAYLIENLTTNVSLPAQ